MRGRSDCFNLEDAVVIYTTWDGLASQSFIFLNTGSRSVTESQAKV